MIISNTIRPMKRNFYETLTALSNSVGNDYRKNSGTLNVTALATAIKINQPTLARMLNGQSKEPAGENADNLCRFFNIDRDQLLGKKPIPIIDSKGSGGVEGQNSDSINNQNVATNHSKTKQTPLISFVTAGNWDDVMDPYALNDAEDWIEWPGQVSERAYVLRIKGLSMFNSRTGEGYPDGSQVKFEPDMEARHGDNVVVRTPDGSVTFKKLQITDEGKYLSAINPDWPEPIIKIPEDSVICGVADGHFVPPKKR